MLKKRGKVWKASKQGGHVIYIPADIVKDSAYPFMIREQVIVTLDVDKKCLTIAKLEKEERDE